MFKDLDKDNSGYITRREIIDATANEDVKTQLDSAKIFELIEIVDDDFKVNYNEFLYMLGINAARESLKAIFNKLDRDGSGAVTMDEMIEVACEDTSLIKYRATIQQMVLEVTMDAENRLTYEEFFAAWKKHSVKE